MALPFARVTSHPQSLDGDQLSPMSPRTSMWRRFSNWLGREESGSTASTEQSEAESSAGRSSLATRNSRRVVPGLPRLPTLKRQESERREKLQTHELSPHERRAVSVGRPRAVSARRPPSPHPVHVPSLSAPDVYSSGDEGLGEEVPLSKKAEEQTKSLVGVTEPDSFPEPSYTADDRSDLGDGTEDIYNEGTLDDDLEKTWILNLSMHFRDRSDREKFFVTYYDRFADKHQWRRVTVSCDYRNAPSDSLEQDLKRLQFQREKSGRIYESIRESLPDIQFYNTVTNLKLQTSDGRLHVHVTEDVYEIIRYPSLSAISHLRCKRYRESSLEFDSHLSGFVYKVRADNHVFIKKEIPGPDSVEEFLYEINALHFLCGSNSVIHFGGVITDDDETVVKGLLISYAEYGALVDILYDEKGRLPWKRRERWAKQIVEGLSEIHEGGFVQGDFTLSNIVIDGQDNAKIIDINRRGCPVGWEPPEVGALIQSGQRISMYIGVKSDIFQLGMVLWAIAEEQDEPEGQPRPLSLHNAHAEVPQYYRELVSICLADRPQGRLSAKELLSKFPEISDANSRPMLEPHASVASVPSEKQYIDPAAAVEREDIDRFRETNVPRPHGFGSAGSATYVERTTVTDTSDIYIVPRGRTGTHHEGPNGAASYEDSREGSDLEPQILAVSPNDERRWEEVEYEGTPYLVQREDFAAKEPESEGPRDVVPDLRSGGVLTVGVSEPAPSKIPPRGFSEIISAAGSDTVQVAKDAGEEDLHEDSPAAIKPRTLGPSSVVPEIRSLQSVESTEPEINLIGEAITEKDPVDDLPAIKVESEKIPTISRIPLGGRSEYMEEEEAGVNWFGKAIRERNLSDDTASADIESKIINPSPSVQKEYQTTGEPEMQEIDPNEDLELPGGLAGAMIGHHMSKKHSEGEFVGIGAHC